MRSGTRWKRSAPPPPRNRWARYGALSPTWPPEAGQARSFESLLALAGVGDAALPERMAPINQLLNELPPEVTEQLLIEFMGRLFIPPA